MVKMKDKSTERSGNNDNNITKKINNKKHQKGKIMVLTIFGVCS